MQLHLHKTRYKKVEKTKEILPWFAHNTWKFCSGKDTNMHMIFTEVRKRIIEISENTIPIETSKIKVDDDDNVT